MKNAEANAFPVTIEDNGNPSLTHLGLTKREYFAGLAMQGMLANTEYVLHSRETLAHNAVQMADELLKQLEA